MITILESLKGSRQSEKLVMHRQVNNRFNTALGYGTYGLVDKASSNDDILANQVAKLSSKLHAQMKSQIIQNRTL